jgi:LuxR family maltose regulon positive regulatory protein
MVAPFLRREARIVLADQRPEWPGGASRWGAQDSGLDLAAADGLAHVALLAAVEGRLAEAHRLAGLVLPAHHWPGRRRVARLARAIVAWQRLALAQAEVDLAPDGPAGGPADPTVDFAAQVLGVRVSQIAGDAATARRRLAGLRSTAFDLARSWFPATWLTVAEIEQSILEGCPAVIDRGGTVDTHPSVTVARARAVLAAGGDDGATRARRLLAPVLARRTAIPDDVRTEAWLTDALAANRLGLPGAVAVGLTAALDAASAEEAVRPFAAAGPDLKAILRNHTDLLTAHPRLRRRVEAAVGPTANERERPIEQITDREGVVLRYLPTRLSAREVAAELHVSVNTVKTQMKSIYRKLGAANRRDAVDRARRQGVL